MWLFITQKLKTMVRIINYKERDKEDGTTFFVMELQGGIEMLHFLFILICYLLIVSNPLKMVL